ncbi:MAG: hypothetical protein JO103_05170, partial [Candidatus Eremiobacteraeota bacterium]|nr:hypothetical protein [Candidatus Eremiobacteraeota bacterium]
LVAAGPGGVFRSTDGGATWEKVREIPGLARVVSANIATVAVAVGNDVWTSDDGGATWVHAPNVAGASIVALGVGADGTVAACAPLVENPAPDWPDLGTMIEGNALTLDRELVLVAGDVIVLSREDDDSLAEAYVVVATKTAMLARFGTVGMTTTVIVDRRVNPLLGDVRRAVIHAGARVRAVVPVKREAPPAPRFALTVPRGLPKLESKRRIAIEGRPARLLLRGIAGGTLRIVTSPTMAKDPVLPYAWPSPSPQSIEPDGDVTAVVRAGARGVVLARFDGVWRRDDVTDASAAWEHLDAPPVAVTGIALRGETIYACGLAPNNDLRTSGVYAFANGAWSEKPLLAGPVERVFVTGDGTLWACRERGLFAETDGTWHAVDALLDDREVHDIAADAATVLAACDDGVYARQGGAWSRVDGLRALSIASVALGNGFWYAGTHGAGVWRRKAGGGAWEPLERSRRTGDVRALLVCDDGTVLAAERGLGISANAVPLAAPLASNVRAFIPVAGEQGAFVLAFAGVPLSAGASAGTAPVPMRRYADSLDVLDAEAQTLDAGMLPASLRARLETICGVKLELAEVVVEHTGRAWRLQVSEAVPVYLLRRGPLDAGTGALRAELFEVARFELLAPPVPYDGSAPAVIPDDAVCRWPVRGTDERPAAPLIARTSDVWYAAARADAAPRSEIASVASHDGGEVALRDPLRYAYDPTTISVAGNVVEATHGATIPADEVIASGDASRPAQTAVLATKPLTNVLTDGVPRPELQVWVRPSAAGDAFAATAALAGRKADDESVRWYRVPDFRASKKRARDYVVRQDADGSAVLTFGDGEKARRLPTGVNNVVARYRVGGGPDGNVTPNRLTLFQTPVRGADRVRNPVAAAGGVAAERVADLRRTVSRGLVALDRVVSQQDLEDYVRAWPGVAKVDVVRAGGSARASFVVTYASRDDDVVDVAALS